jgi:hypothetical protein
MPEKFWCRRCGGLRVAREYEWCDECERAERENPKRIPRLSTVDAKKEVLDYLITTLDFIQHNLPEDLLEVEGEAREPGDVARILIAIRTLRTEFMRRTRPSKKT